MKRLGKCLHRFKMAAIPRGKKRVSRHKKKHWRKHTDIQDIEENLEEKRFEERTGGLLETRPNEILFFEDKKQPLTKAEKKKLNSFHQRKQVKKEVGLRCHQLLEPSQYPKAVAVPKQARRVRPLHPVRQAEVSKKLKKSLKAGPSIRRRPLGEKVPQAWIPEKDVWEQEASVQETPLAVQEKERKSGKAGNIMETDNIMETEYYASALKANEDYLADIVDFYKQQTKQKLIKVPKVRYAKPSSLPSVEVPAPGASYNPAFDDYQKLLEKAAAVEIKKQKEEDHLNRVLIQKFPTKAEAPTQATWIQEMSQGLYQEASTTESEDDSQDLIVGNPPTRCERKLRSKRRREEQQKIVLEMSVDEKLQRKRENDIYRIKKLKSEIRAADSVSKERQAKRQTREAAKRLLPAKLGQHKYEAPDIEVHLSTELSGGLRLMKPEGCLLEDRLKSFQRRNIIEPRVRQNVTRKYKPKRYTRKSHKEATV